MMGRLLAALVGLVLLAAGCTVKTEGAPCTDDSQCPSGQACGYNRVCSEEAKACAASARCRTDTCEVVPGTGGGVRECAPDSAGICATLAQAVACTTGATCGVVNRIADCLAVAISSPGDSTQVDGGGVDVSATVTYTSNRFRPPTTLVLVAGSTTAATLALQSATSSPATYRGHYAPGPIEGTVSLVAKAAASPDDIPSSPVSVFVDGKKPTISNLGVSCPGSPSPCVRDDVITVTVDVSDTNLTTVDVSLDLDPSQRRAMPHVTGSSYSSQLNLRDWPFGAFNRDVVVRVTAADSYGNSDYSELTMAGVTRARPAHDTTTGVTVTSPAVETAGALTGTIVFGTGGPANQLRGIDSGGNPVFQTTLEISPGVSADLKAAPSVGGAGIFAGSEDGRLYRVGLNGQMTGTARWPSITDTSVVPFNSLFTPIISTVSVPLTDHAYSAGGASALYQFYSNQATATLGLANPVSAAGAFSGANPFFVTSDGSAAALRRFSDVVFAPSESWAAALQDSSPSPVPCDNVQVPLAVDAGGNVIIACENGQLHRVANASSPVDEVLYKLPAGVAPTGSPVVLFGGDILVPTSDGNLVRLTPGSGGATLVWSRSPATSSGEVVVGVVAADTTAGNPAIYATTSKGRLIALDTAGSTLWSGTLDPGGQALGFPTIAPVPPSPPPLSAPLPTLYAGSSNGRLYRVVVDRGLDASAPWPKAHHDIRNTGSSDAALP